MKKDNCCGNGCCSEEKPADGKSISNCCSTINCSTLLLRIALGIMLFWLGLTKFFDLSEYMTQMQASFEGTFLPAWSVAAALAAIPYAEVALGFLLFFGLFTFYVAHLTGLYFVILIFGLSASNQIGGIPFIFIYLFATLLIIKCPYSRLSLDRLFGCKTC